MSSHSAHKNLVHRYLRVFFVTHNFSELAEILATEMIFTGPFFESDTAQDYIASLERDPPTGCSYNLLHLIEENNQVVAVYDFKKGTIKTVMAQYFHFRDNLINRIRLVFDTSVFVKP